MAGTLKRSLHFCPKAPKKSVICAESAEMETDPCDVCGWNPENEELIKKRLKKAKKYMEVKSK